MSTSNHQTPTKKSASEADTSSKKTKEHPTDPQDDPELKASPTKRQKTAATTE